MHVLLLMHRSFLRHDLLMPLSLLTAVGGSRLPPYCNFQEYRPGRKGQQCRRGRVRFWGRVTLLEEINLASLTCLICITVRSCFTGCILLIIYPCLIFDTMAVDVCKDVFQRMYAAPLPPGPEPELPRTKILQAPQGGWLLYDGLASFTV